MIHHPVGRIQNEESALAHNWDNWNKCLYSIVEIIYLETNHIQKTYKRNSNILHWCPYFAQVAASTYFLVITIIFISILDIFSRYIDIFSVHISFICIFSDIYNVSKR